MRKKGFWFKRTFLKKTTIRFFSKNILKNVHKLLLKRWNNNGPSEALKQWHFILTSSVSDPNLFQKNVYSFYNTNRIKVCFMFAMFLAAIFLFLQTIFQSMFEGLARRYGGCDGPDCGHQWDGDIRGHVSFPFTSGTM